MILDLHRKLNSCYKRLDELPFENEEFTDESLSLIHEAINNEHDRVIRNAMRRDCAKFLMLATDVDDEGNKFYVAPKDVFKIYKDSYLDTWLLLDLIMDTLKRLGKDVPLDNRKYDRKENK